MNALIFFVLGYLAGVSARPVRCGCSTYQPHGPAIDPATVKVPSLLSGVRR